MVSVRILGKARRRAVAAAATYDDALPSLFQLASQHRFDEIIEILQFQRKLEHWLCVPNPAKLTALHMVLLYHPPVALLDVLIASLGRLVEPHYVPEATVDVRGQTPLHVAASSGCDISILKRLTKMSHIAVFHHDNLGRLPLHCLCSKDDCVSWPPPSKRKVKRDSQNTVQCIHLLVDIHPQACIMRDIAGRTPLDLAVENRMDQSVLSALRAKTPHLQQRQPGRFRHSKSLVRSATTKSMSTTREWLPIQIVSAASANDDDVSSVGLRSFYWKARDKHFQPHRKRNATGPVEI